MIAVIGGGGGEITSILKFIKRNMKLLDNMCGKKYSHYRRKDKGMKNEEIYASNWKKNEQHLDFILKIA